MTEELKATKIEELKNGKFTVIAKVTVAEDGAADKKFLQRGILSDETGSIDFVIYRNAQLDALEVGKVYKLTNAFASDNSGFLTLRPNNRMDRCSVSLINEDLDTNLSRIFRDQGSIPSVLKDETSLACSMIFDHIISEKFPSSLSIGDKYLLLADLHDVLIDQYKTGEPISYGEGDFQTAYMFGFFPFYVGMIYHILRGTEFEKPSEIFHDDIKICLYGCGPAPELLGITAYLRDFHPQIRRIKVIFLDQNIWDDWRQYCLEELLPLYWDGEIEYNSFEFNILDFPEGVDSGIIEEISSASIHSFQNVISDLYQNPENLERLGPSFFNLYQQTSSGSIMILSDQYYGKTARILNKISIICEKHGFGTTLVKPDLIQNYQREFDMPQPMMNIDHFYKRNMGFYAMILKKT